MKWLIGTVLTLIVITVAAGRFYTPPVTAVQPVESLYKPQALVTILNRERAANGVAPLKLDPRLNTSAQAKADDMVKNNYYDHVRDGVHGYEYVYKYIPGCKLPSENLNRSVNFTSYNPIKSWDTSPIHKAAQLNPQFDIVGFYGGRYSDGQYFYVAHFCNL